MRGAVQDEVRAGCAVENAAQHVDCLAAANQSLVAGLDPVHIHAQLRQLPGGFLDDCQVRRIAYRAAQIVLRALFANALFTVLQLYPLAAVPIQRARINRILNHGAYTTARPTVTAALDAFPRRTG
jgi:hypothetical protein